MISTRTFSTLALVAALVTPACATDDKESVAEDFSDLATADQKSDAFSNRMKIVGSLEYGQVSAKINYSKTPRFRAFKFAGDVGDKVTVDVRSTNGGDAVAWVLDDSFEIIASNDDAAAGVLDSHMEVTLPEHPSRTHYIVFREYALKNRTFKVELQGVSGASLTACNVDTDCVKVGAGCCRQSFTAVAVGQEQAYRDSLGCDGIFCAAVVPPPTDDVAQCNNNTKQCELVDPLAIRCGGHVINMHTCPDEYVCAGAQLAVDVPGSCRKPCGGLLPTACEANFTCIDNPTDQCDPANGGADCDGICAPKFCGGFGSIACPGDLECIEDTADDCDVNNGGADCGGVCANH